MTPLRGRSARRPSPGGRWRARLSTLAVWALICGVTALVGYLAIQDRRSMQADAGPAQTAPAAQPPLKEPEQSADAVLIGRVTRVSDGDTIRVELSSGPITVRLDGVDAPEKDQPWGREAASALSDWVLDRDVELAVVTQDQYDRLVAQVVIGDLRVNERLVKDGHAWAFRRYLKQSQASYCSFESAARAARRGLWSLDAREWVYPSDWRRLQRRTTDRVEDFSAETAERCRAAIGKR